MAGSANLYLLEEVETAKQEMLLLLGQLTSFMAINFHPHNGMSCLYPLGSLDRTVHVDPADQDRYQELAAELEDLVQNARQAYAEYRATIAHSLYV